MKARGLVCSATAFANHVLIISILVGEISLVTGMYRGLEISRLIVFKILLAFVWTDDESKLGFDMFLELVAADCTNSMNQEERPVMLFSGLDSNMRTFSHTWVFMPSESKWAFRWVIEVAMPGLHELSTLHSVKLFVTYQDGQLNFIADQTIGHGKIMPAAIHHLCAWHKLDRNLTEKGLFKAAVNAREHDDSSKADVWHIVQ